ncbi:MAG: histidine--tRNA ligase [Saprospiraceae bacterium]|nr:histidine--tRNA ligase [Saprospiraceae bacterium]
MKPSILKGTRDFTPEQVIKRNYIFDTIKRVFIKYGFQPIETPAMENLETLTGKYGEEGDKLLFKVLNNGNFLEKADKNAIENGDYKKAVPSLSKRGLRYDLTVPFARFVVMNQHDLAFPFKRYQIQPVWRADNPQKGRYQEFYQCDVDVVGSDSLVYEAELSQIYDEVFAALGVQVVISINNRKILAGLAEAVGIEDHFMDMTIAIDKLDKIGLEGVQKEMLERGIPRAASDKIAQILEVQTLEVLKPLLQDSKTGRKGIEELETVFSLLEGYNMHNTLVFDITLARGLNYYTGCIFEVKANTKVYPNLKMGSIGGGGRYDDLTSVFGLNNVSGVGISFGAERVYDVMEELNLFPTAAEQQLKVMFIALDESTFPYAFRALNQVRSAGINAEIYPEPSKMKKQMKYANARNVPFVILVGTEEMASGKLGLKNMASGEQKNLTLEEIVGQLSN